MALVVRGQLNKQVGGALVPDSAFDAVAAAFGEKQLVDLRSPS